MIRLKRNLDAWRTSAAEISQRGSPAVSCARVRITGTPKREEIFIPTWAFLPMATAHSATESARSASENPISRIGAYPSIDRNASEGRQAVRWYARGARQERTQRSSSFCPAHMQQPQQGATFFFLRAPLPSSILFFVRPARSATAAAVAFDLKSARLP